MHSSGSILMTTIERIRTFLDDPSLDAKYSNDFLVRHIIEPEMVNVITVINQQREEPILCKFLLDNLENTNTSIELPPNVGIIHRIAKLNADGTVLDDIARRDETDPRGPGWSLDGRDLHIRPDWADDTAGYEVWYTPSGDFVPHYSDNGGELETGALTFTLSASPDVGDYDRREGAYIGGILRVWNAANTIIQEQVISGYDVSTRLVTVRTKFGTADIPAVDSLRYEIVPEYMGHIWQAIAVASAMNLGVSRNITEKQMAYLKEHMGLTLQTASQLVGNKLDNKSIAPENSMLYTMLQRIRWGLPSQIESEMSNDYIMRSILQPKLSEVMMLMNGSTDSQTVIRYNLTLLLDAEYHLLPPCVYKGLRIAQLGSDGTGENGKIVKEIRQREENDPHGNGWAIEGNRLSIRPYPEADTNYSLWYVPSGDFMPHYAKDGVIGNAGKTEIDLTSGGIFSRQLGTVDKRENAYVGATIRVFEVAGGVQTTISERTITSHNAATNVITVSEAFTSADAATVAYEIVAPWMSTVMSAVVTRSILELMTLKGQMQESDVAILAESAKSALTSSIVAVRNKNTQRSIVNKDSVLHMILEKTKTIISDIAKELDYSDDYIFRHGIVPEYSRVMSRIQNSSSDYVISKFSLSLVADQQYYKIPACIGEIVRIVSVDDNGRITGEMMPRNQFSQRGPNWSLEGNTLAIRPYPVTDNSDFEIWYIPSTDAKPHYAEMAITTGAATLTMSSGAWGENILGDVDGRDSIYEGSILRLMGKSKTVEEHLISSSTSRTGSVSTRFNFHEDYQDQTDVTYEIVPTHFGAVSEAVSQGAAMNLLVGARRVTKAQHAMLMINFKSAMKTALDHFTFMQNRMPKKYERDTVDNKIKYGGLFGVR